MQIADIHLIAVKWSQRFDYNTVQHLLLLKFGNRLAMSHCTMLPMRFGFCQLLLEYSCSWLSPRFAIVSHLPLQDDAT